MNLEEIIDELVAMILMQEDEINELKEEIYRIKQHLEVYEEYIEGGAID